jgi:anti-sigma-K factor RskA
MAQPRITTERLLAYAAGDLPADEARAIEAHLAGDPEAARTIATYRHAARQAATDDSTAPPAATVARSKRIARTLGETDRAPADWLTRLQSIVADLVFDSRLEAAAVRDEVASTRVQLGFEANEIEVELQADREGEDTARPWRVLGQIDADQESETIRAEIAITTSGTTDVVETSTTDERGMFSASLPDGRYDVHVRLRGTSIVLRDVDLR